MTTTPKVEQCEAREVLADCYAKHGFPRIGRAIQSGADYLASPVTLSAMEAYRNAALDEAAAICERQSYGSAHRMAGYRRSGEQELKRAAERILALKSLPSPPEDQK